MRTEHEKHKLPPGDEAVFGYLHAELSHFLLQNLHDLIVIRGKKGMEKCRTRVTVTRDFN